MKSEARGFDAFLLACLKIQSLEELDQFFDLFFTIEEKNTLSSRYLIIKELLEGKLTQREIAKVHSVSIAQITRGSNALKRIDLKLGQLLKENMS
jgi:TrpR family transcriptional regulator, trp operon repressor